MQEIFFEETTKSATNTGRRTLLRQEGERTPLVPLQACAGWAKTVNCHAHPRILLPQNRCLPEPLAAPFPHQPEPRCNTLDFASKVVCQRAFRRSLDSSRQGTGKWGALRSAARPSSRTKNEPQVLLDNSQNMHYHSHKMNIMFITIYSI